MRISDDIIEINTKERGVGQVPSCGSATVAAAYWWSKAEHPVTVMCRGGGYRVEFTKNNSSIIYTAFTNTVLWRRKIVLDKKLKFLL